MAAKRQATVRVGLVRLPHAEGLPLPAYQTDGAAGLDLVAAVAPGEPMTLAPGARALVPTGLKIELPEGFEAQVRPRSGLALRHGVTVLNSPGTIDSDYRGELQVILVNLGDRPFVVAHGERIAQLVVQAVVRARLVVATRLRETHRGQGGFGSTGTRASAKAQSPRSRAAVSTAAKAAAKPVVKSRPKSKPKSTAKGGRRAPAR